MLSVLKLSTSTEQDKGRFDERFPRLVLSLSVNGFSPVTLCCGLRACPYPLIGGSFTVSFVSQMIECRDLLTPATVLLTFLFFYARKKCWGSFEALFIFKLFPAGYIQIQHPHTNHFQLPTILTRATREQITLKKERKPRIEARTSNKDETDEAKYPHDRIKNRK